LQAPLLGILLVPASADQDSLAEIRGKGYVRVCADPANLPFSSAEGSVPGFELELAKAIAERLGVRAQFHWMLTWVRPGWELKKGNCDLFLGLPVTAHYRESNPWIAVSRPYYTMNYAILTTSDASVTSPADLAGKRVAVDAGRPAEY
jgi:polar amino acid transport system substrate-binding protein